MNRNHYCIYICIVFIGVLLSCNKSNDLEITPTRQYSVVHNNDTITITENNLYGRDNSYHFVPYNGEYYNIDRGKAELFLSVIRDTLISGYDNVRQCQTKIYIGKKEKSPYHRSQEEALIKGDYVSECYIVESDARDGVWLQRAYYYDKDYKIVGIREFGYNDYN